MTRKEIRAIIGETCTEEMVDKIVALHRDVVDPLKDKIDNYEKAPNEADAWKTKYETEHNDFEAYKKDVETAKVLNAKKEAYKAIAKDAGLSDEGIEKALKYADWNTVELDEGGKIKDAKTHMKNVKEEWSGYLPKTEIVGAKTATPPTSTGGTTILSKAEIYKKDERGRYILSTEERQKALLENTKQKGT